MHRIIVDAPAGMVVDHINHDALDNRRANLRVCTQSQNLGNQIRKLGSSKYKGVSWHKAAQKWHARIQKNDAHVSLGLFDSETDAARAYDSAAREHFGEFALCNFDTE